MFDDEINLQDYSENDLLKDLQKLPQKRQEYYRHLIKADILK